MYLGRMHEIQVESEHLTGLGGTGEQEAQQGGYG